MTNQVESDRGPCMLANQKMWGGSLETCLKQFIVIICATWFGSTEIAPFNCSVLPAENEFSMCSSFLHLFVHEHTNKIILVLDRFTLIGCHRKGFEN